MIAPPAQVITATALNWTSMAAARWSGLQLVLYLVPDLRRHCVRRITNAAVEFFAALGSSNIKQPKRNFHRKIRVESTRTLMCSSPVVNDSFFRKH